MVYALKTQRLTTRKPLKDRFLTCQIHPSSEEKEGYAGCLFSLIEIDDNNYSSSQIGHSIINTTAREYFRQNSENASENFEVSLRKTNELLANYTQEGKTEWIGNLNGIIALIYKDEIHLTCIGKSNAQLIREGHLSNMCQETNPSDDIHPLCTFSNITSGKLETSDVILFASKNLFSIFPKKDLKQLIEINSLEEASIEIAQNLSAEKITDLNMILIETTTKENIANEPLSNIPETIYIDETNESLLAKTQYFMRKKVAPKTSAALSSMVSGTKKTSAWLRNKGLPNSHKTFQAINHSLAKVGNFTHSKLNNVYGKFSKNDIYIENDAPASPVKINHYHTFPKFKLTKRIAYPALIIILLIILISSVTLKIKHNVKPKTKTPQTKSSDINLSALQTKYDLAKTTKPTESITLLQEINTTLSGKKLNNAAQTLLSQSQQKYNTLTKTTPITIPSKKITTSSSTKKIIILSNQIFAFTQNGEVYKNSTNASELNLLAQLPSGSGDIVTVSDPNSKNNIFIYTSKQKIYSFSPAITQPKLTTSNEPWKGCQSISTFTNNLYLLDNENQIWKYTLNQNGTYSTAQAYLSAKNQTSLTSLENIAIDGSIFALAKNGKISKIQKNTVSPIEYQKFPAASLIPSHPKQLFTSSELDNLFIVEDNKIIITDKAGNYLKTLALSDQNKIEDIYIQPILKKIWVLTGQTLFSTDY